MKSGDFSQAYFNPVALMGSKGWGDVFLVKIRLTLPSMNLLWVKDYLVSITMCRSYLLRTFSFLYYFLFIVSCLDKYLDTG